MKANGFTNHYNGDHEYAMDEESLLCEERLTAASPELWPESVRGVVQFVRSLSPPPTDNDKKQSKKKTLIDAEDIVMIHKLGNLSDQVLFVKTQSICNIAMELSLQENHELSRGNMLDIFGDAFKPIPGIHHIQQQNMTRYRNSKSKKKYLIPNNKKNGHC